MLISLNITTAQNQYGFGLYLGAGHLLTSKGLNESPQNTFYSPASISIFQSKLEFSISRKNFIGEFNIENNNYLFSAFDRSKNILFFPKLRDGRGAGMKNGERATTITLSLGRKWRNDKFEFDLLINAFFAKYKKNNSNFEIGSGHLTTSFDSLEQVVFVWSFLEIDKPKYNNKLFTYGIGLKANISYKLKGNFKLKFTAGYNKGFETIVEKKYQTKFISYTEPEKNAIYYNTLSTKGSNFKYYLGVVYNFDLKRKEK